MRSMPRTYACRASAPVACARMYPDDEPGTHYGGGTEKLSQLSDIVSLSQDNEQSQKLRSRVEPLHCTQNSVFDLVDELPSQAVLPTPEMPFGSQRNDTSGACGAQDTASEIPNHVKGSPDMPSADDEQCYMPERTKSGRRATRRGYAQRRILSLISRRISASESCEKY